MPQTVVMAAQVDIDLQTHQLNMYIKYAQLFVYQFTSIEWFRGKSCREEKFTKMKSKKRNEIKVRLKNRKIYNREDQQTQKLLLFSFLFFGGGGFRATPVAYGGSQARGRIRATAASLHHSHSNVGSEPHLQPTPQLSATLDPY